MNPTETYSNLDSELQFLKIILYITKDNRNLH